MALVDALVSAGISHACVSPGSRNTPLLLAIGSHPALDVSVHHDERSAAFFALGLAKATGRPPLLSCTSGTAATEYLPAVTEAFMSHTPLIALTADRPPELQGRGAPQTINQTNLYGAAAKWFFDTGVPDRETIADAPRLAGEIVARAIGAPAGPIHINIPLREPLVPAGPLEATVVAGGTPRIAPAARNVADRTDMVELARLVGGRPALIVAGPSTSPGLAEAIARLAAILGAAVIADPQCPIRFGGAASRNLVAMADLLIAAGFSPSPLPEVVLQVGAIHTSKPVNQWLQSLGAELIHIHDGRWSDPLQAATKVLVADPATVLGELADMVAPGPSEPVVQWRDADAAAAAALAGELTEVSEPAIARTVTEAVPAGAVIVAGSSMPIRLIDSYGARRPTPLRLVANRGANGIDGTIATALGVAAAGVGPTYALIGDLTALADVGSLLTATRLEIPLTIIVINNDGGGIFEFLPQADPQRVDRSLFENLIATPHHRSVASISAAMGVPAQTINELADLAEIADRVPAGPRLIEIHTSRRDGPTVRSRVLEAVARAIFGSS